MPAREVVSRDERGLALGEKRIDYVLVRRRGRRGVGLKVDEGGLTVSAPASMPLARIEALVRESESWVLRKVAEWSGRRVPPMEWRDGAPLPYLGAELRLRVAPAARPHVELGEGELIARVPQATPERLQHAVIGWYKRTALAHLAERTAALAALAGLAAPRVFVSSARARWGSCNARREIRLAWRLIKARPALIDYVICHELAHLRHMNHSAAFWSEVESHCPDYRRLRDELFSRDHLYRAF